jgi:hypothetical protein
MQVGTTWQPVAKIFFAMANGPTQAILSVRGGGVVNTVFFGQMSKCGACGVQQRSAAIKGMRRGMCRDCLNAATAEWRREFRRAQYAHHRDPDVNEPPTGLVEWRSSE